MSDFLATQQNTGRFVFGTNATLSSTIDDWRTVILSNDRETGFSGLSTARNAFVTAGDNMIHCQSWAASGVAPTWRIGWWRWAEDAKAWVNMAAARVTVTAHSSSGSSTINGDTLYPPLSHVVDLNTSWVKYADGDATYKHNGEFMVDPAGAGLVTFAPYHASATSTVNLLVSWW